MVNRWYLCLHVEEDLCIVIYGVSRNGNNSSSNAAEQLVQVSMRSYGNLFWRVARVRHDIHLNARRLELEILTLITFQTRFTFSNKATVSRTRCGVPVVHATAKCNGVRLPFVRAFTSTRSSSIKSLWKKRDFYMQNLQKVPAPQVDSPSNRRSAMVSNRHWCASADRRQIVEDAKESDLTDFSILLHAPALTAGDRSRRHGAVASIRLCRAR